MHDISEEYIYIALHATKKYIFTHYATSFFFNCITVDIYFHRLTFIKFVKFYNLSLKISGYSEFGKNECAFRNVHYFYNSCILFIPYFHINDKK